MEKSHRCVDAYQAAAHDNDVLCLRRLVSNLLHLV